MPQPKDQPVDEHLGKCCICNQQTKLYCGSCAKTWGEFDPTYYCEKHYESVVMTGNCCSGNEAMYGY